MVDKQKLKVSLMREISAVYTKANKMLVVLDKLSKKASKLNDAELDNSLKKTIKSYSKAVDSLFDARYRVWGVEHCYKHKH